MTNFYQVVTLEQRPKLKEALSNLHTIGWTKFMREDPIGVKYWNALLSLFPQFQFLLLNKEGESIACGNAMGPLLYPLPLNQWSYPQRSKNGRHGLA